MVRPDAPPPDRALYLHGSIEAITNEVGTVTEPRSYDAFGARRDPTYWSAPLPLPAPSTSPANLGFTGHEDDTELGLVNMRGRLYDSQLARFLTPDPVVAHPGFGQSWNPYSYVLNGPLSYVDPTGFTEEEPEYELVEVGSRLEIIIHGDLSAEATNIPLYEWQLKPSTPKQPHEEPREAADSGATVAPQDTNTWGNNAGWVPQPPATTPELPQQPVDIAADIGIGTAEGLGDLAVDVAKSLVLNALTFGGYGTWQNGKAMWAGYQEDGILGALNAINPFYQFAKGGADTTLAATHGDYRAAGAAGLKTLVLGAAMVLGARGGAAALEARGAAAAGAARGAVPSGSVGAMRRLEFQASSKHPVGASPRPGVSPGPVHGQDALDISVGIEENTSRRVGIDYATSEFVVFDEHLPGIFHGHTRPWSDLTQQMQNALTRAGMTNRKGRFSPTEDHALRRTKTHRSNRSRYGTWEP